MTKILSTILFFLFLQVCIGQTSIVVGTWKLTKHITTFNKDKNYDCMKLMKGATEIMQINANGTYERTWKEKSGKTTSTVGKWKISSDNKKITLYSNYFKPKTKDTCADRTYDIVMLTTTEFQFKENMCTEDVEGITMYTKVK